MSSEQLERLNETGDESYCVGHQPLSMNPESEREAIRQRKRERMIERVEGTSHNEGESSVESTGTPTDPVHIQHLDEFNDVAEQYPTVLVDFHAEWCGPCKQLDPIVRELASELPITVAKVDIDDHQSLAQQHNVRGVPTLVLYAEGEPAEHLVGMQSKATLTAVCEQYT